MDPSPQPQVPQVPTQSPNPPDSQAISAMVQPVVQAATNLPIQQQNISGKSKETGPVTSEVNGFVEMVGSDSIEKEPLPLEVASWMEKVNRDTGGEKPPEIVIADPKAQSPSIPSDSHTVFVLPLGEKETAQAMNANINDSVKWLATWCKKMLKKLEERVAYQNVQ